MDSPHRPESALHYPMDLGAEEILDLLPHRGEMLLVRRLTVHAHDRYDGIVHWPPDSAILQGHFPGLPLVPGVLMVEAVAQVAGAGMRAGDPYVQSMDANLIGVLASIRKCTFRRPVLPGQDVCVNVSCRRMTPTAVTVSGILQQAEERVADVEILLINTPRPEMERQITGAGKASG